MLIPKAAVAFAVAVVLGGPPVLPAQADAVRPERTAGRAGATMAPDRSTDHTETAAPGRVTLELTDVRLEDALQEIARLGKVRLSYSRSLVPLDRRVSVQARNRPVLDALRDVLDGTDLEPKMARTGQVMLVRRAPVQVNLDTVQRGTVVGRVTDAKTGEGIAGADVRLMGTRWRAGTAEDGRFRLADVAAGSYTLSVRRIGYAQQSRAVTVAADRDVTVDVVLEQLPTQLDEVVTTVTGEQRVRELGHVVGRINADSLVREAPVLSVTELLTARVPGLLVQPQQGTVGGEVKVRVRSPNSIALSSDPIVIVDGVRYQGTGTFGAAYSGFLFPGNSTSGYFGEESTSRLNDLNPSDIESIEVVKGPSAAALYGTDAANGVIVITTKQGQPGPARWRAYARATSTETPEREQPDVYWGWSSGTTNCTLRLVGLGRCVQDSVTVLSNPLNQAETTIFGSAPRWEYGANVSGGSQDLRYFFSADLEDATGPVRMPTAYIEELKESRGIDELPDELVRPNAFQKINLRSNVAAHLGKEAAVRANVGYTRNDTRAVTGSPYQTIQYAKPDEPYGNGDPRIYFLQTSTEQVNRFSGNVSADWRPAGWLTTRAMAGLDLTNSHRYYIGRERFGGIAGDVQTNYLNTSADLGATASFGHGRLSSRTSVGVQYYRNRVTQYRIEGFELPPASGSPTDAARITNYDAYSEKVTLGSYVEEVLGLNDRLFLSGSIRFDGASGFGQDYDVTAYPKLGVSWIVSDEPWLPRIPGLDELRLRYAFGSSGQQAWAEWVRAGYQITQGTVEGMDTPTLRPGGLGNPDLKPERIREHEVGLDLAALSNRVRLALTYSSRRTRDMLVTEALPAGLGSRWSNLGLVTGHGFEAQLAARVLDHPAVSWDLMFTHAYHTSRVEEMGGLGERKLPWAGGGWGEGYPIGALFSVPLLSYEDANGDGIITEAEVVLGDEPLYVGVDIPPQTQTLSMVFGFFRQRLRISTLLDRQAGHSRQLYHSTIYGRKAVDPTTPLDQQAQAAAEYQHSFYSEMIPADFVQFRELSVAYDLPAALLRPVRMSQATLSLAARNLGLWTSFVGDPESTGIPQSRVWTVRLDVGF